MSEEEKPKPASSRLSRFKLMVEIVIAIAAAYSAWQVSAVDTIKKNVDTVLAQRQDERDERKQLVDLHLTVYKEVVDALKAEERVRADHVAAAQSLVTSLLRDDPQLQEQLISALSQRAANQEQKQQLVSQAQAYRVVAAESQELAARAEKTDAAPRQTSPQAPGGWDQAKALALLQRWDIDVFYCQGRPTEQALAQQAATALKTHSGVFDRVRLRELKAEVNRLPGYNIVGYKIAATPDEEAQANALRFLLQQAVPVTLENRPVGQRTNYYLSVFFCGQA